MLSLTGQYAVRAMVYLAQHADEWPITGREIAHKARIPANYLSKVMGDLVRAGLLESTRGVRGGFRLARPAREVRLYDVLRPFESVLADRRACPFGHTTCSDRTPCLGHAAWKRVRDAYGNFLRSTSVYDVAIRQNGR